MKEKNIEDILENLRKSEGYVVEELTISDYARLHSNLGDLNITFYSKEEISKNHYEKAIELEPDDAHHHLYYGRALVKMNDYDNALVQFQKAIELSPENPYIYNDMGIAYAHNWEEKDNTISCFLKALELKPDFENAKFNLDNAFKCVELKTSKKLSKGRLVKIMLRHPISIKIDFEIVKEKFQKHKVHQELLKELAGVYLDAGAYKKAEKTYLNALIFNLNDASVHFSLSKVYGFMGKSSKSYFHLKRSVELSPTLKETINNNN